MTELRKLGVGALERAYRARDLSPVEVVDAVLARMDEVDPVLNAFCFRDDEGARRLARESESRWTRGEARGALDGVPVSVKDLINVAGMPTRYGSRATEDKLDADESPAIANLRHAGAIIIGKTTTPEFGHKGVTESPLTGITRNPWNTAMTPGGSSGGAGAALGSGMAPIGSRHRWRRLMPQTGQLLRPDWHETVAWQSPARRDERRVALACALTLAGANAPRNRLGCCRSLSDISRLSVRYSRKSHRRWMTPCRTTACSWTAARRGTRPPGQTSNCGLR